MYTDIACLFISKLVTGSNLQGIHKRYQAVPDILVKKKCWLSKAMRHFGILRNTLQDYIGISELSINFERYHKVVEAERQRIDPLKSAVGWPSANKESRRIELNKRKSSYLSTRMRTFTHKSKFFLNLIVSIGFNVLPPTQ